jgi:hypothetical protein
MQGPAPENNDMCPELASVAIAANGGAAEMAKAGVLSFPLRRYGVQAATTKRRRERGSWRNRRSSDLVGVIPYAGTVYASLSAVAKAITGKATVLAHRFAVWE